MKNLKTYCALIVLTVCQVSAVTVQDFAYEWLAEDSYCDINEDGIVNYLDFTLFNEVSTVASSNGQIVAERFKHNDQIYYIYQPTGKGDWFRWRIDTWKTINNAKSDEYHTIDGAWRGKVYAGGSAGYADADAVTGFGSSAGTFFNYANIGTNGVGQSRSFDIANHTSATPNKCRIWRELRTINGIGTVSFTDGAGGTGNVLGTESLDFEFTSTEISPSLWLDIPAGTVSVKLSNDGSDGTA